MNTTWQSTLNAVPDPDELVAIVKLYTYTGINTWLDTTLNQYRRCSVWGDLLTYWRSPYTHTGREPPDYFLSLPDPVGTFATLSQFTYLNGASVVCGEYLNSRRSEPTDTTQFVSLSPKALQSYVKLPAYRDTPYAPIPTPLFPGLTPL